LAAQFSHGTEFGEGRRRRVAKVPVLLLLKGTGERISSE
jgi:hypothetical protein